MKTKLKIKEFARSNTDSELHSGTAFLRIVNLGNQAPTKIALMSKRTRRGSRGFASNLQVSWMLPHIRSLGL